MSEDKIQKEYLERIVDRLMKVDDSLREIDRTLVKQEANLEKHMLRTEQNETMIEILINDIKPIKKHVTQIEGVFKFFGIISFLVALTLAFIKLYNIL